MTDTIRGLATRQAAGTVRPVFCAHCGTPFEPRRSHQKFCAETCRHAFHREHPIVEGVQATVAALRVLKSGKVAATLHFDPVERDRAMRMTPGEAVNIRVPD